MLKNNKKALFLFCLFLLLGLANSVLAIEINYPRLPGTTPPQDFVGTAPQGQIIALYALYIFNLAIWIAGVVALGALIYTGFLYLTSTGKPEKIARAKEQLGAAFLGILLLLSSYIVLRILNPQLLVLELPALAPVQIVERPEVPPRPSESYLSSIDADIPFGEAIERIFEEERMERIVENAQATLEIAEKIEELNDELQNSTNSCTCPQTESICTPCVTKPPSTSDPCDNVRSDMESTQQEILEEIDKLVEEQAKTLEEIELLKKDLGRLEQAESFTFACPLSKINSLAQFLDTKNFFTSQGWSLFDAKFLEEIKTVEEWASFSCQVSGTIIGEQFAISPDQIPATDGLLGTAITEEAQQPLACTQEVPVGDIIDRTKRVAGLLIEQMENLVKKDRELVEAVAKMQVSVSECSSRRCTSVCIQTKKGCVKLRPVGAPCPFGEIGENQSTIEDIVQEISEIVGEEGGGEATGIVPVSEEVAPKIIEDLGKEVRQPMRSCVTDSALAEQNPDLPQVSLSSCEGALRSVGPGGKIIQNCCLQEPEFQQCLNECYLEKGQEDYKSCLNECLAGKSEKIASCKNALNFYCCGR